MNTPSSHPSKAKDGDAILLVNDRPDQLLSLSTMLEPLGVDLVTVESGPDALRQMLQREFSVMLLDVHMPGMNGFEIADAIRLRPRSHLTPIIFISASHSEEFDSLRGYESGAFDYILVPVSPAILRAKVAGFLKIHRMHKEISQQASHLARLNQELSERNNELKEIQQSKDLLTGMIIHDLRNPLTACFGNLDLAMHREKVAGQTPSKYLSSASDSLLNRL
jgi:CheY-like chemotaxis protein